MNATTKTVPAAYAGSRIDTVIASLWELPRNHAGKLVADGHVTLNGDGVRKSVKVAADDLITVVLQPGPLPAPAPELPPVRYEDDQLLVVDKPVGLVVHAGVGNETGTLVDALKAAGMPLSQAGDVMRPGIVHRLDKDTSGLLVVAKTDAAYHSIVDQLKHRRMHRSYVALVLGIPKARDGVVDGPIGRDPKRRTRFAVVAAGKPARTRYRVHATGTIPGYPAQPVSLLDVTLETGRTHQIRVHLAALGTGIVGDDVYGVTGAYCDALGLKRPFLHAYSLTLRHPVTDVPITVTAPLPDELAATLTRAGVAW